MFREINACEYDLLKTCEFNNKLSDYEDLNYNEELCTKEMKDSEYKPGKRQIYYADFETDVTVSPHRPYLCCTVTESQGKFFGKTFKGDRINEQLLDFLQNDSITYFHNLKYDVCFFINTSGWKVNITERSGTVLKVVMSKYSEKDKQNRTKLLNIFKAGLFYLKNTKEPYKRYRIDIISVLGSAQSGLKIEHLKDISIN